MEILLVAAILVIIASMATLGFTAMQRSATSKLTLNEIKSLETGCNMFKITHLKFPNKLEELVQPVQGMNTTQWGGPYVKVSDFNDPWGQEYKYSVDEVNDRVLITSAGPDRQPGTEDDITNAT
jgi:general secretion pathway protein G